MENCNTTPMMRKTRCVHILMHRAKCCLMISQRPRVPKGSDIFKYPGNQTTMDLQYPGLKFEPGANTFA